MATAAKKIEPMEPEMETPEDRFHRIGQKRMSNLLNQFRLLETLATSTAYRVSEDDRDRIFEAIDEHVTTLRHLYDKAVLRGTGGAREHKAFEF